MKQLIFFTSLLTFLFFCGCQAKNVFPVPVTPSPFLIGFPADLSNQNESAILQCARVLPGLSLQTNTYTDPYPDPSDFNLLIWQGNPFLYPDLNTEGLTFILIDSEEIVVIVSPDNKLSSLSSTDLQSIFVGKAQDWSLFPQSGLSGPIELWVYYDTHPLRLFFEDFLFGELTLTTSALIAPSQAEVNSLIEKNKNSLSYIGKSRSSTNTRILPLSGIPEAPVLSVFVIFQDTEEILVSPILDCLQINNSQ